MKKLKEILLGKDKELETIKKELGELKKSRNEEINQQNKIKKLALQNLKLRFQPSLVDFIDLVHTRYLTEHDLTQNQASMLRRTWLLSHFGIVFNDFQNMNNELKMIARSKIPLNNLEIDLSSFKNDLIENDSKQMRERAEFYQLKNSGQPEANVIKLWNPLFDDILKGIQG